MNQFQWNYFATSHGKGAVDGIGGTLKRLVWNAVSSRKVPAVTDARSFYKVASMLGSATTVSLIEKKAISEKAAELDLTKCFKEAVSLPGISRFHCIEPQTIGYVHSKLYSTQQFIENEMVPRVSAFDLEDSDESTDIQDSCTSSYGESGRDEGDINDGDGDSNNGDYDDIITGDDDKDDSDEDGHAIIDDDKCNTVVENQQQNPSIKIDHDLPPHLSAKFGSNFPLFNIPLNTFCLVDGILSCQVMFKGSGIIDKRDLDLLVGGHTKSEDNYLTKFDIDEYLQILKTTREDVSVISWEIFEKFVVKKFLSEKENLLKQEIIIVPCNSINSKHWFLTIRLPQEKIVAVLDSKPGNYLKSNGEASLKKMWMLLQMVDSSLDESEWQFVANKPGDLPQQDNVFDCGVFACLYDRCLVTNSVMAVDQPSFQDFRKHMTAELHWRKLIATCHNIQMGHYYAVDYVNIFYIGRALDTNEANVTRFKFLYRIGARRFDWPKRDDVAQKHCLCVFYGPVALLGNGPFEIEKLDEIESIFRNVIKKAI